MATEIIPDIPCKQCTQCGNSYPITSQYWHRKSKANGGGFVAYCKGCAKQKRHERYLKNREHENARNRAYFASHKEQHHALSKAWYEKHRDEIAGRHKEHMATNPEHERSKRTRSREKHRDAINKRRRDDRKVRPEYYRAFEKQWRHNNPAKVRANHAMRRGAIRSQLDARDIELQLKSQKGRCWHCGCLLGEEWHVDHLIPVARGGSNEPENLVISCPKCNLSKGAKLPQEWNGRLF